MANEKRLIDADALCEFFQERYEYLRNASETPLPNGNVLVDTEIQVGAIIAKEFLDKAKDAPTVDAVEVVHAKWNDYHFIKADCPRNGFPSVKCSHCDIVFCDIINVHSFMYHYCPNCGAKMDGDGNG